MAYILRMPQFGITMTEGTLTKWLVQEGSRIEKGMPIYEVETDKYNNVVESEHQGTLIKMMVQEGDDVPVHGAVGILGEADEDISDLLSDADGGPGPQTEPPVQPKENAETGEIPGISILKMPQFGITMVEGTIMKWLVQEGDCLHKGMPIYEVETDKYNNVVESEAEGTLLKIVAEAGTDVPVHGMVGIVGAPGTDLSPVLAPPPPSTSAPLQSVPAADGLAVPSAPSRRVRASPLAKKTAKALDVDLSRIKGSGMDGRIVQADVLAAKENKMAAVGVEAVSSGTSRTVKLNSMRRAISRNMSASWAAAPMATYSMMVNMTELERVKTMLAADHVRLSYTDLLTKITAVVLLKHPYVNCSLDGDMVTFHEYVNMGVAVALEDGLVVPVVKNAHLKGLTEIAEEIRSLAERARDGKLSPDDAAEATFTISNLGMYGIDGFTPIINQPQSAILGVNRIYKIAVEDGNEIKMVPQMKLSLTADHRVIDGAEAAKTLGDIKALAENPWKLFL